MPRPDELIDVIDVTGRVLKRARRTDVRRQNLLHRAVAILCRDSSNRIYVHRRTKTKDVFPGMHDMFVSGIVRAGEGHFEAANRELAEELAIEGSRPSWLFDHLYMGEEDRCLIGVYEAGWDGPISPDPHEISWGAFVTLDELRDLMRSRAFVPDSLDLFPRCLASLDRRSHRSVNYATGPDHGRGDLPEGRR